MIKTIMHVMKVSVLLLLAPQSQSSMCPSKCMQDQKQVDIQNATKQNRSGLEVEFPLVQTLILEL